MTAVDLSVRLLHPLHQRTQAAICRAAGWCCLVALSYGLSAATCPSLAREAADAPAATRRLPVVEDLFTWSDLQELVLSPDGRWAVATVLAPNWADDYRSGDLWLTSLERQAPPVQLTRHPGFDSTPVFSPDSRRLAFLSDRSDDGTLQIFVYDLAGGEPYQITTDEQGAEAVSWSPDGRKLYYLRPDPLPEHDSPRRPESPVDDTHRHEAEFAYHHVWSIDLETREARAITAGAFHVTAFEVSPAGEQLVIAAAPTPLLNYETQTELYLVDVHGGPRRQLTDNRFVESQPRWSPDGRFITYATAATQQGTLHYIGLSRLFAISASGGQPEPLMAEVKHGLTDLAGPHFWHPGGKQVVVLVESGVTRQLLSLSVRAQDNRLVTTQVKTLYEGERLLSFPALDQAGQRLIFCLEDAAHPRDVYLADWPTPQRSQQWTKFNPRLSELVLATCRVVHWNSQDGTRIEGLLYRPAGAKDDQRLPLIVNLHGGPLDADKNWFMMDWWTYPHQAAARGYSTLFVNYRGSTGYGDAFARAIVGQYYTLEVQDILSGVDALVERGLADRKKLAIQGWSNGGILSAWITTKSHRFGAAAVGAADVNWISDFGTADIGLPFDLEYFGGTPWDRTQHYLERSPLFQMDRVRTPTLILHGAADWRVPTSQGYEHFRALKQVAKAPVQMLVFPREEHDLAELSHQRTKVEQELAWFDRYVLADDAPPEPLDEPLLERVPASAGCYGLLEHGLLVPETLPGVVAEKAEQVQKLPAGPVEATPRAKSRPRPLYFGRFEVTCAQYQAFLLDQPQIPVPRSAVPSAKAQEGDESEDVPETPESPAVDQGRPLPAADSTSPARTDSNEDKDRSDDGEAESRQVAAPAWDARTRRHRLGLANHPVTGIAPQEAQAYVQWLSHKSGRRYRLPSVTEWRLAARSGGAGQYPWGNSYESGHANSSEHWTDRTMFSPSAFLRDPDVVSLLEHRPLTVPVGGFAANAWHLYDMAGNVAEICRQEKQYVALGGSWNSTPAELAIDNQQKLKPTTRRSDVGFRVVLELEP